MMEDKDNTLKVFAENSFFCEEEDLGLFPYEKLPKSLLKEIEESNALGF